MLKKNNLGKVLHTIQGYSIRQSMSFQGNGKQRKCVGQSIGIYAGKNLLKDGYKSKAEALIDLNNFLNGGRQKAYFAKPS